MDPSVGYWPCKVGQWPIDKKKLLENFLVTEPSFHKTHTLTPYVTGSSVLGIKYKDGVMLAADTLASYGSLARFRLDRIKKINKTTLLAASGEMSDFHSIVRDLDRMMTAEFCMNYGHESTAHEIFSYLSRVMYHKRNRFDPLWNQLVIAGFDSEGKSMLGYIDLNGTAFRDDAIATGFGAYLALPALRNNQSDQMTEESAFKLLEDCLKVLFYRDARASSEIQIAKITRDTIEISSPYKLSTDWSLAKID
ncbi:proteasome subunit beta type-4-like [Schistocerca gregaria]|uniref:proteasome subunit beta type-4-like n=1 Tax=Schistocerca gregaria TaxID=7010 RepID=UPI00211DC8A6|nr:proteasome subunit beta type-4-like [Schistocerca gregaria]